MDKGEYMVRKKGIVKMQKGLRHNTIWLIAPLILLTVELGTTQVVFADTGSEINASNPAIEDHNLEQPSQSTDVISQRQESAENDSVSELANQGEKAPEQQETISNLKTATLDQNSIESSSTIDTASQSTMKPNQANNLIEGQTRKNTAPTASVASTTVNETLNNQIVPETASISDHIKNDSMIASNQAFQSSYYTVDEADRNDIVWKNNTFTEKLMDAKNLNGNSVYVESNVVNTAGTYYHFKIDGKDAWLNANAFSHEEMSNVDEISQDLIIDGTQLDNIWSQPYGTIGAHFIDSLSKYDQLRAHITGVSITGYGMSYRFEIDMKNIGWLNANAFRKYATKDDGLVNKQFFVADYKIDQTNRNDNIWSLPEPLNNAYILKNAKEYNNRTVRVIASASTSTGIYYQFSVNNVVIGWMNRQGFQDFGAVNDWVAVPYHEEMIIGLDSRNEGVWTNPPYSKNSNYLYNANALSHKKLVVLARQKVADKSYSLLQLNNNRIGWIETNALQPYRDDSHDADPTQSIDLRSTKYQESLSSIHFNWGDGAPVGTRPNDFTADLTQHKWLAAGKYFIHTFADDGISVSVGSNKLIDKFEQGTWNFNRAIFVNEKSDFYDIKTNYREGTGGAVLFSDIARFNDWIAYYYNNQDVSGAPIDAEYIIGDKQNIILHKDYGDFSPTNKINKEKFSARFVTTADLVDGIYKVNANADDGTRLFVDGQLVLDGWENKSMQNISAYFKVGKSTGNKFYESGYEKSTHLIEFQYRESTGKANIKANLEFISSIPNDTSKTIEMFYDNTDLSGAPKVVRESANNSTMLYDYNWGTNAPIQPLKSDNFSASFTRNYYVLEDGQYEISIQADDGVRLFIDNQKVIDSWIGSAGGMRSVKVSLTKGNHLFCINYLELTGNSYIKANITLNARDWITYTRPDISSIEDTKTLSTDVISQTKDKDGWLKLDTKHGIKWANSQDFVRKSDKDSYIYTQQSLTSEILIEIPKNSEYTLLYEKERWQWIKYKGIYGWLFNTDINKVNVFENILILKNTVNYYSSPDLRTKVGSLRPQSINIVSIRTDGWFEIIFPDDNSHKWLAPNGVIKKIDKEYFVLTQNNLFSATGHKLTQGFIHVIDIDNNGWEKVNLTGINYWIVPTNTIFSPEAYINVYEKPDFSKMIGKLQPNSKNGILDIRVDGWLLIKYGNTNGWIAPNGMKYMLKHDVLVFDTPDFEAKHNNSYGVTNSLVTVWNRSNDWYSVLVNGEEKWINDTSTVKISNISKLKKFDFSDVDQYGFALPGEAFILAKNEDRVFVDYFGTKLYLSSSVRFRKAETDLTLSALSEVGIFSDTTAQIDKGTIYEETVSDNGTQAIFLDDRYYQSRAIYRTDKSLYEYKQMSDPNNYLLINQYGLLVGDWQVKDEEFIQAFSLQMQLLTKTMENMKSSIPVINVNIPEVNIETHENVINVPEINFDFSELKNLKLDHILPDDFASSMAEANRNMEQGADLANESLRAMIQGVNVANRGMATVNKALNGATTDLNTMISSINVINNQLSIVQTGLNKANSGLNLMNQGLNTAITGTDTMVGGINAINGQLPIIQTELNTINNGVSGLNSAVDTMISGLNYSNVGVNQTIAALDYVNTNVNPNAAIVHNLTDMYSANIVLDTDLLQKTDAQQIIKNNFGDELLGLTAELIPGIGNGLSALELFTGKDIGTGEDLSGSDLFLSSLGVIAGGEAKLLGKGAELSSKTLRIIAKDTKFSHSLVNLDWLDKLGIKYTGYEVNGVVKVNKETRVINRRVYQMEDIDWNFIAPGQRETNLELAAKGISPFAKDGSKIELHHLTQNEAGTMVELPASVHEKYSSTLHGTIIDGESFRNDPVLKKQYNNFRTNYWKDRAKNVVK